MHAHGRHRLPVLPQTTRWTMLQALEGQEAEQAWAWFIDRYRDYVRGALRVMLKQPLRVAEAEEQFWGYIYLSKAIPRADQKRRFRTYLAGILRNFALAYGRSQTRSKPLQATAHEPPADAALVQAELAVWADTVVDLALRDLHAEQPRAAAAIRDFYGFAPGQLEPATPLPTSVIAARLQCTNAAVYQLLARGRARLRELIENELRQGCSEPEGAEEELRLLQQSFGQRRPGMIEAD